MPFFLSMLQLYPMVKAVYAHTSVKEDGVWAQDIDISYDLIEIFLYSLLMNLQNEETA